MDILSVGDITETDISYNDFDAYSEIEFKAVIDTLSDEYRNLIYLTYMFGYKSKEIAGIYGLTASNIRKNFNLQKTKSGIN